MDSVVIVGGGASAVLLATALVEGFTASLVPRVTVVERNAGAIGPGLAYGRSDDHHLLNSPAGKMSASSGDDLAFVRWCEASGHAVGAADFVSRALYGEYLADDFSKLVDSTGGRVAAEHAEAVSILHDGSHQEVQLADGRSLEADIVVLALGNPPPAARIDAVRPSGEPGQPTVVADPWAHRALDRIRSGDRVLLVGTGLTMVDIATSLARRFDDVQLTATSRTLLLPRTHLDAPAAPGPGLPTEHPANLGEVIRSLGHQVRASAADQRPWQPVIDGMRPQLNRLWDALTHADRVRFLRHGARLWDVHRHRMSPVVAAELQRLLDTGTLRLESRVDPARFDVIVNCTGPASVADRGWNPLVDALLDEGMAHADPLGLGLDVDDSGAVRRADGTANEGLYAIGPALRGTLWETTAVPEIRQQAASLAGRLALSFSTRP